MNFTTSPLKTTTLQSITIDWSQPFTEETNIETIDAAIAWLQRYPNTRDIHVIVGKSKQRILGRRLQSGLQRLGCRVTTRQTF